MDKALANHPADRYQHVSQFGRDLVTAVASMPDSAFTSTGTVELAPLAAGKTEVRPLGGGAATRRDRTQPDELPLPELEDQSSDGRPVAIIFAVLLLAVLGGGGWFYWNGHKAATPHSDDGSRSHHGAVRRPLTRRDRQRGERHGDCHRLAATPPRRPPPAGDSGTRHRRQGRGIRTEAVALRR